MLPDARRTHAFARLLALLLAASPAVARATSPLRPAIQGARATVFEAHAAQSGALPSRAALLPPLLGERVDQATLYPRYDWPLARANHDGVHAAGYVDQDATAGFRDYRGGPYTYDTHRGTDIGLHDFRAMDRGFEVIAAAPGTVTFVVGHHQRDRNCAQPDNPTLNFVEVANGDGTYTYYYHLRASSVAVEVGEAVQRGQMLGLVGSSGYSFGPHLHFEAADWLSGSYVRRDPWSGPSNPQPGLWAVQPDYVGDEPTRIDDVYVTTETAAGGDLSSIDYCSTFAERMTQPAVLGIDEPYLPVVLQLHGRTGEHYRIEIRRPDQSLFAGVDHTFTEPLAQGLHWWAWYWNGNVSASEQGVWTVDAIADGMPARRTTFTVGATTVYGPRFAPGVGRSYRVNGVVQRDTLRISPLGAPVTYALVGAPAGVTLTDSVLTLPAASSQPSRSAWFQAVATDAAARRDTAWFHLVDPSKPPALVTGVPPRASDALALAAFPSPARGAATLRFTLPRASSVSLAVFDLSGRRVRRLLDPATSLAAGEQQVRWDGRDDRGAPVGAGVYFAALESDGATRLRRIVLLE